MKSCEAAEIGFQFNFGILKFSKVVDVQIGHLQKLEFNKFFSCALTLKCPVSCLVLYLFFPANFQCRLQITVHVDEKLFEGIRRLKTRGLLSELESDPE